MAPNPYEAAKREEKASKIARCLRDAGASVDGAGLLDPAGRRAVEQAAEVNPSSDETWGLAFEKLRRMLAAAIPDDPFEGLSTSQTQKPVDANKPAQRLRESIERWG